MKRKEPVWVDMDLALAIHRRQLAEHGGLDGVRDEGSLRSALARAQMAWNYGDPKPTLAQMAAKYAHGLALNHPFLDGNKRTAAVVMETFLILNGQLLTLDNARLVHIILALAAGELAEDDLALRIEAALVDG